MIKDVLLETIFGATTGSIASAFYGIPEDISKKVLEYLDDYLIKNHDDFNAKYMR